MNQHISSDRLIGHHRARPDYEESPMNTLQFGFGDHRYTKMTYEILKEDDKLKQKIMNQLVEDFVLCENINQALLSSDILSVLFKHLKNKNDKIRYLSTLIIKKICASPMGRRVIIERKYIEEYEMLINDKLSQIKCEAYDGLIDYAEYTQGINDILEKSKILEHLVDKLIEQKEPQNLLKDIILLKILMQGEEGTPKALKTQIISRLMNLISHASVKIQYNVCMTLANISFNEQGKSDIVTKGHIKGISNYIDHHDKYVRESSTLLLCSLAQINQGKDEILANCSQQKIQKLLDDQTPTVLNTVQLIANLGEHPQGRKKFMALIGKLNKIDCIERKYIDETIEVLEWKP